MPEPLDHLFVTGFTESRDFKSTLSARKPRLPERDRQTHGAMLLQQIAALAAQEAAIDARRRELELPAAVGMTIAIEVAPPGALDYFKQLEWSSEGIEILSVVEAGDADIVALHVPEGRLSALQRRVQSYLEKNTKSGKPANAALVNAISAVRRAVFDELWTDDVQEPPAPGQQTWFQVWLRQQDGGQATRDRFQAQAERFDIEVEPGHVSFPGRTVIAVRATRESLEQALELLDLVAEIRGVAPTAEFFLGELKPHEQAEWVNDLVERCTVADPAEAPYVTLMDTGVNNGHPLLVPSLDNADMHAVDPGWNVADHEGHGTEMAGIALHGNLVPLLAESSPQELPHRLESIKILPPDGQNAPHLYGWVTAQAASRVEQVAADRRRTFAMMTTSVGKTAGLPSEWSASIDRLAYGVPVNAGAVEHDAQVDAAHQDAQVQPRRRLFVLSAGNVPWTDWANYPSRNDLSPIENPGQAWNALTVGAYTELVDIDLSKWPDLKTLAPAGAIAPCSMTSMLWKRTWPFKPDVVAEGGNGSLDNGVHPVVGPASLRLLTTSHDLTVTPLAETGDTSAACAEVARICGHLSARYGQLWPESIRALVVHSARYTAPMRGALPIAAIKKDKEALLRRFGYGVASLDRAINSTASRATLVLQESIAPYKLVGREVQLSDLNMHALPWPVEVLQALGGTTVELRITLSYFVEPNPSRRGWQSKFRYQSHGLRFAVKGSTEDEERFGQRINKLERDGRDDDDDESLGDPDVANWFLGAQLRARGSIHSDVWRGTAAQLAAKSHIAVFPVGGWWKDWRGAERHATPVRYSLVVTLEVLEDVEVDIYTPIADKLEVPVAVEVPLPH